MIMRNIIQKAINDFYISQEASRIFSNIDFSKPLDVLVGELDIAYELDRANRFKSKSGKYDVVNKAINSLIDSINNDIRLYLDVYFKDNKIFVTFDTNKYNINRTSVNKEELKQKIAKAKREYKENKTTTLRSSKDVDEFINKLE